MRSRYPRPLHAVPPHVAAALTGGGGAAPAPLAALYQGGQELHDGTGHLPRDADGYYLSRTTGERLLIDAGYAEGASVGAPKMYGLPGAVVEGRPASGRRTGFTFSATNYIAFTLNSAPQLSMIARATAAPLGAGDWLFEAGPTSNRLLVSAAFSTGKVRAAVIVGGTTVATLNSDVDWRSADLIVAGRSDAGNYALRIWDGPTGAHVEDVAASGAPSNHNGTAVFGQTFAAFGSYPWAGLVACLFGWDGAALTAAQEDAIAAAVAGGSFDVDAIRDAYAPDLASDGLICGAYDPAAPTVLYTLSGSGDPVVVAQP